jgi:hypothetical protein
MIIAEHFWPKHVACVLPEYNVVLADYNINLYLITQRGYASSNQSVQMRVSIVILFVCGRVA